TRSTLARLERQPPRKTDIVITALGVNDITRLTRPSQWIVLQQRLWDRIGTLYEPRRIYLSGVPPLAHFPLLPQPLRWTLGRQAAAFEAAMKDHLMQRQDVVYVPFDLPLDREMMAADGFHPAPRTYALWGKQMASRIISDWPEISNGQELPVTFAQRHPGSPRRAAAEAPAGSRGDRQRDRPER
ncbi:MAG: SGNH/GDSL hydrolase family protein, partial [Sulfitobacter sp.]|nr:SGNH/GDSL hydrolase family protein [Sulfitobacter sp.]